MARTVSGRVLHVGVCRIKQSDVATTIMATNKKAAVRGQRPCYVSNCRDYFTVAVAACSINFATTSGCEMNATWLASISLVVAFMRFA